LTLFIAIFIYYFEDIC